MSKGNNRRMSASNLFDEMTRSDFEEWRSPSCILEVTIHKVCYPITEFVLLQVFGSFGVVEQVHVCLMDQIVCWIEWCSIPRMMQQMLLGSCMAGICIQVIPRV